MQRASAHWIRHTAATDLINQAGVDLEMARDLLGHGYIGTTRTYLNGPRNAMHDELSKRHAISWAAV